MAAVENAQSDAIRAGQALTPADRVARYELIQRLHDEKWSLRRIAAQVGVSQERVRQILLDGPLVYGPGEGYGADIADPVERLEARIALYESRQSPQARRIAAELRAQLREAK